MAVAHAFGTTFTWNSVVVGKLTSIGGVEVSTDTIDVSTHQSADKFKEFMAAMSDGGEVSIEGLFDPADTTGQHAMLADQIAGTSRTAIITPPSGTGTTWTFTAIATRFKIGDFTMDGAIPFSATVKISGKPTFAVSTSTGMSALTITTATLYPTFAIGTYTYTATTTGASVTVTPTAAAHTITVTANSASQTVSSGGTSSAISAGSINTVTPIVISVAETNKAPKTYTIYLTKTA